jgi:hypothetical protein
MPIEEFLKKKVCVRDVNDEDTVGVLVELEEGGFMLDKAKNETDDNEQEETTTISKEFFTWRNTVSIRYKSDGDY